MLHVKGVTLALHRGEVLEVLTAFSYTNRDDDLRDAHWHDRSSLYYVKEGIDFPFHGYALINHLEEAVGIIRQVEDYP